MADLSVTKTVSNPTPNVGDQITFFVTLSNPGPDTAAGVEVTDLLPAGVDFVSASASQGSYNSGTGLWDVGTVTSGAAQTLIITARVVSPIAQTNTATISAAGQDDPDTSNNTASVTETPQQADLSVVKTVSNPTPNVGDQITFIVTLSNPGPDTATGVEVTDLLPAGVDFVSANPSQGSYNSATGLWDVGTVNPGGPQTLSITARVVSPGTRINVATITDADQFDPNTGNNSADATETTQLADLSVTKTLSNPTPNVGDQITYTITLNNAGSDAATGVQVTDLLPAGVSFVSATPSQGSYVSGSGVWTVGAVSPGASQTLIIAATVVSPGTQINIATITDADQFDPDTGNNTASATETPQLADLSVTKMVSNPTPNVGDQIVYTITLTDTGPDDATGVQVTDLLPAGVSFVSATPSKGSYVSGTGVWTVGTVSSGAPQTLIIAATVVSPGTQINIATITDADQFDPDTGNNSASADLSAQAADLLLIKSVSDPTPNVGDQITFTVTLSNQSTDVATGVQVTDLLPTGLSFVSATPSQGNYVSGTGLWDVGTVSSGTPQTLTIIAAVVSAAARTNTATVTDADQFDPNTGNNTASATETPQQADLLLIKSVNDPTPNVGDQITFTVKLSNQSPDDATGVQVTDLLPTGVSFVSANPSQGSYVSGTGLWDVGTVSSSTPQTLTITGTVASPIARTNTATISDADQFDPNTGNNSASATETPQRADLVVAKTVSNPTPNVSEHIVYTITLFNAGPDVATGVEVTDVLPAGVSFVSANASQGSYDSGSGEWTLGTVNSGVPQTLAITVTVDNATFGTNTASISHADQFDPNTANNTDAADMDPEAADLLLIKSVSDPTPNVGDQITFSVTVVNNGPHAASGVQVTDLLPPGVTFVTANPGQGTYDSSTGLWDVGTLANGAQTVLTIGARVVSPVTLTNTGTISDADQSDPNIGNNSASATETPQQADLSVTKTVSDPTPNVGDQIVYTITLNNAGSDAATGVQVTDLLPAGVSFVSANPSQGSYASGTGLWDVGTVSSGTPQTLIITGRVISAAAQTNVATVTDTDQFDPNTGNNSASATETPQQADLSVIKTVNNQTPNVGDQITFTITLTNQGPDVATGVQVTDLLPAGLSFVLASTSQGSYNSGSGVWTVGTVSSLVPQTLTILATVVSPAAQTNTGAVLEVDQFDPDTGNNSASATITTVNDAPVFSGLDNNPTFIENGTTVVLDGDATVSDLELAAQGNFGGAVLTLVRNGGANPDDVFGATGSLDFSSGDVTLDGGATIIGSATNFDGTLQITFNSNATSPDVNSVLQQIIYSNASDNPPAAVPIDYSFSDGNTGLQGSGPMPGVATGSITVDIDQINDSPVLLNVAPTAAYLPGSSGTVLSSGLVVFDSDAAPPSPNVGIQDAIVTIQDFVLGDQLFVNLPTSGSFFVVDDGNGPVTTNISVQTNSLGRLVLAGTDSPLHYQLVLDAVSYKSIAVDPSNSDHNPTRTITWQVNDGAPAEPLLIVSAPIPVGLGPRHLASADLNGDGVLDLVTANLDSDDVSVLLGIPGAPGQFGAPVSFPVGIDPLHVAIAKIDGDSTPDLVVAHSGGGAGGVSVLLGDGTGSFGAPTDFPMGLNPVAVAVADFNNDGNADLVTANNGNDVSVRLGTGTGSFGAPTSFPAGIAPTDVVVGDFNNDGKADLAVSNLGLADVFVLLGTGTGTGTFGAPALFPTGGGQARGLATADLNGDGFLDLVTANNATGNVSVLLGTGTGVFIPPTTFLTDPGARDVAIADLNGDGRLDLAVANQSSSFVSVLLGSGGSGSGAFQPALHIPVGPPTTGIAPGDYDNDGALDLAVSASGAGLMFPLFNTGTNMSNVGTTVLHFGAPPALDLDASGAGTGFTTTYTERAAPIPIVDSDVVITDPDDAFLFSAQIVLTNAKPNDVLSIAGALPGGIDSSIDASVPGQITVHLSNAASLADYQTALGQIRFNNTSTVPDTTDRDIAVTVNNADASNVAHATVQVVDLPNNVQDFNADGKGDIFWQTDGGALAIWQMAGFQISFADFTRLGASAVGLPGPDWHVIDTSDVTGDGKTDILWRTDAGKLAVWQMDGTHIVGADFLRIGATAINAPAPDWHPLGAADFDGDGKGDLLWRTDGGALAIWELNGSQIQAADFIKAGNTNVGVPAPDWRIVGTGDFGGDGKADILWETTGGALALWQMDGTHIMSASFLKLGATNVGIPGFDWHVSDVADFDGDGKADILWRVGASENVISQLTGLPPGGGKVAIWEMNGDQIKFADYTKAGVNNVGAPGLDWHLLGADDHNGDGKADLLWQTDAGKLAVWQMDGTHVAAADYTKIGATDTGVPAPDWHVFQHHYDIL